MNKATLLTKKAGKFLRKSTLKMMKFQKFSLSLSST